jgi:hypothetical protein
MWPHQGRECMEVGGQQKVRSMRLDATLKGERSLAAVEGVGDGGFRTGLQILGGRGIKHGLFKAGSAWKLVGGGW